MVDCTAVCGPVARGWVAINLIVRRDRDPFTGGPFALDLPHRTVMLAATEDRMEQQSAAGVVFLLALVNAWLATRRMRSAGRWFFASLLLAPIVLLITLYLLTRPERPQVVATSISLWGWMRLLAIATAAILFMFAVLVNVAGQPQGEAVATSQPQPVQAP